MATGWETVLCLSLPNQYAQNSVFGHDSAGRSRISQRAELQSEIGGCQPIIWPKRAENCMKTKKIGPEVHVQNFTMQTHHCDFNWVLLGVGHIII